MGRVSTDDAARRQEFKWLGTPDVPTPFEARGSAWGLGIALSAAFSVVAYLATPFMALLPGPFIVTFVVRGIAAVLIGIAAAVPVVRWVGKRVSPERRIRYHRRVLLDEIAAHRPNETATTTVVAGNTLPLGKRPEHVKTTLVQPMRGTHDARITLDEIDTYERALLAPTKD